MKTLVTNVVADLREKRLWPVALVLVLVILAGPRLLGGGAAEVPAAGQALPAPSAEPALPTTAQVLLAQADLPGGRQRDGRLRDPFARRLAPKVSTKPLADTPSGGTGGGAPPVVDTGGVGPSDFAPLPSLPAASPPRAAPVAPRPAEDLVTVRVGRAGALRTRTDVESRTPLPSVDDPFLVYLGTKPDGLSAQFLVSADATPTGDAICVPSPETCEQVVLKPGMTEFFDVAQPDGSIVQYQLDVVRAGAAGE